jgi:tetratricopeptide (TPR) repeat protein
MRMKFLARKLVNDLTSGEKIFVYRVIDCTVDKPDILRLAREINRYGTNVLLFVAVADDRHPAFHVRHVHPGLMVGYIDHFEVSFGQAQGRNHTGWLRLCREALRVWQAGAPETPELPAIPDNEGEAHAKPQILQAARPEGMSEATVDPASTPADTSDASSIPRDFDAACAWARQAAEASDWVEARDRWAQLRDRFPAEGHPWWQEAIALREAGQASEAQALLLAGARRFPHDSSFPHDLARLAEGRSDWPEAERWWRAFLGLHPNLWWAHTGLAQALTQQDRLDDAEAVLLAAHEALPNDHPILLDYARLADQRRDWAETERRFRHLTDRFPDVSDGPWRLAAAVREQGRLDEAEQLLREGFERHPSSVHFPNDLAHLAQARGDWAAAEQWWRALLAIDPNTWWAHTALANALHQQGRRSDAEAVLLAAHAALPGEPNILIDHARLAEHAGDWPAALERWTLLRDRLPADPRGHVERAAALRQLGRHEEAEATLIAAAERFPREPRPLHDLARAAEMRADWAAAERWWRAHGAIDPNTWEAQVGLAAALCQQGDVAPAMAILQALAARPDRDAFCVAMMAAVAFGHAPDVAAPWLEQLARELAGVISSGEASPLAWLAHANLAKRCEQFEECRARLEDAAARFPEDRGLWLALADARELAPRDSEAGPAPPVVGAAAVEQDADRRLLESFESLGGTPGGCEFGLHQRDHGFEPLSLLRWASIAPDQLCRLLEQQCEGLGALQTVSLRTQGHADWQAVELTYGIQMDHTHLDRKTVPIETATRLVCTRLKFLARKLIDDLRLGEKVFVYRLSDAIVPTDVVARLQQAVAAYGDGRLLLVGEGTPATPPIELQRLSPRCLQVIRAPLGQTASHAARLASWHAICRAAADEFGLAALAEAGTP